MKTIEKIFDFVIELTVSIIMFILFMFQLLLFPMLVAWCVAVAAHLGH